MANLAGWIFGIGPVLAVLAWCNVRDRRRHLANRIRADVNATVNRVLGGESLVGVEVAPATRWRAGQVRLSTPGGYDALLVCASEAVLQRMPDDYELVARPTRPRA